MGRTRRQKFYKVLDRFTTKFIFINESKIEREDSLILTFIDELDLDVLYRSPEFNRQFRLRLKYHKMHWNGKN
jgi:hypothetical protein